MCQRPSNPQMDAVQAQLLSKAGNLFLDCAAIALQKELAQSERAKQEPIIDVEFTHFFDSVRELMEGYTKITAKTWRLYGVPKKGTDTSKTRLDRQTR